MKHTIIREQPVLPPAEKIVLEVTPQEFLTLLRAIGWGPQSISEKPVVQEGSHGVAASPFGSVFQALNAAGREAGLTK